MVICCRGPGGLLYGLYEVMHIVLNFLVRFKGNFEGKIFGDIITKRLPISCFCAEGGWAGLRGNPRMHGYENWRVIRGQIEASLRLNAVGRYPLRDTEVEEVGDFPSVTWPVGRFSRGDMHEIFLLHGFQELASLRGN